jgi:hypothetical protein
MPESDLYTLRSDLTWKPISDTYPLPVAGSFSATISGFTPNGNIATPLAASGTTGRATLPAGVVAVVSNVGSVTAFVRLGDGTVDATTSDFPVFPSTSVGLTVGSNDHLAAITSTGTTTLNIAGGSGLYA